MAVLVEAISVIVRRPAIDERFNGGWPAFLQAIPNQTGCLDKHIVRVGFMSPDGVHAFVTMLEHEGLIFIRNREAVDIAIVDQMCGPTVPAPWLTVGKIELSDSKIKVDACWLTGQAIDGISLPPNWKFDGSMSFTPGFFPTGSVGDRLKFLRHDNNVDVYLDLNTNKEVFVGRPVIQGDSEGALETQLQKICQEALGLETNMEYATAMGNEDAASSVAGQMQKKLLQVQRIVASTGQHMAKAHFTYGLILRIMKDKTKAERAFRKANDLQPGDLATLLEIVRCLGEQSRSREALPFARKASEVGPADAGAWGNLAMCLIQCGERAEALKAIDFALELDPNDQVNQRIRKDFAGFLNL